MKRFKVHLVIKAEFFVLLSIIVFTPFFISRSVSVNASIQRGNSPWLSLDELGLASKSNRLSVAHVTTTGTTDRVSISSDGTQGNYSSARGSISGDGRYVAFESSANTLVSDDTNNKIDVFVHDHQTGQTSRISIASDGTQGNDTSTRSSISVDGRYVTFD